MPASVLATLRSRLGETLFRAFAALFALEAVLIAVNIPPVPPALQIGQEGEFPTFLHSGVLAASAAVLFAVAARGWRARRQGRGGIERLPLWAALGVAFAYMSMDEALELHERASRAVFQRLGIYDRMLHYEITPALWEALFAPLFVVIALLVLALVFQERRRAAPAFPLGLATLAIWALALVTEFVEMTFLIEHRFWFGAAIWLEESSELVGSTVFLVAAVVIARAQPWNAPNERDDDGGVEPTVAAPATAETGPPYPA